MLRALYGAHLTRFAVVGLAMTALHLATFRVLVPLTVPEIANVVAFLCATQVNFVLSYFWTWSSRRPVGQESIGHVFRRAVLFTGSAAVGFTVNAAAFSAAYRLVGLSPFESAVTATAVSAVATFLLSSRLVFTRPGPATAVAAGSERGAGRVRRTARPLRRDPGARLIASMDHRPVRPS